MCLLFFFACQSTDEPQPTDTNEPTFYRGADLSYVNEMEDCGGQYFNRNNQLQDPYQIFQNAGTDLVRLRLWHNPDWTNYSNYKDVEKSIARAKAAQMDVLLDFHYSDDWADPYKQKVPTAWLAIADDLLTLGDSVYQYTYKTLEQLHTVGLLPNIVQVGNETNVEILQLPDEDYNTINWNRNAFLLNKGIKAVRDAAANFGQDIDVMLHIAQPENALWWFQEAKVNGLTDFDWIGLSYYPKWSNVSMNQLPNDIRTLVTTYDKRLMIVETAYPFTLSNADPANNILGEDAAIEGAPINAEGQLAYLKLLEEKVLAGQGEGIIYWEPAWISTSCSTQWGQGSHWDNATLFDHDNKALVGMEYYNQ